MDTSKKILKEDPHADKNKALKKMKTFPEAEEDVTRGTAHPEAEKKEKTDEQEKPVINKETSKKGTKNDLEDYKNNNLTQREPDWQ
jgi:hypothetical protein